MNMETTTKPRRSRSHSAALSALRDILSRAEHYKMTSAKLNSEFAALRDRFNLPSYEWQYLRGFRDCRIESWQHRHHEFRYVMPDGRLVPAKWDAMSEADQAHVMSQKDPLSGHYWIGTDSPWFVCGKNT